VIQPLLFTAIVMAAFFALCGFVLERWGDRPVRWAGLAATMPVVTLGITYLQVARFQADTAWALAAAALATISVTAATAAMREGGLQRAGAHAAGAIAAICVGLAIVLHDQWVTLAIALMLPPLAWIGSSGTIRDGIANLEHWLQHKAEWLVGVLALVFAAYLLFEGLYGLEMRI
jgi:hypothetical protein